jgi:uncharacterized protein involved in exopolysaccharide biosynthesis
MSKKEENIVQDNFVNDEISLKDLIINIKDWIVFLKSKWIFILIFVIIGSLIGFYLALKNQPTYKATLTFAMEEEKSGGALGGALGLASSFGLDLGAASGGGAFAASNLSELMKSRLIVQKVLLSEINIKGKKESLLEYYIKTNNLRKKWSKNPYLSKIQFIPYADEAKFTLQQDSIIQEIVKNLVSKDHLNIVQKDKKVTILTIEVFSNDELFSKIFCESIAKETSDFYIQTKSKKARINVDVLQKQVDSVRNELNESITGVASETDNVYNLNPAYNIKASASKKKQIDVQANSAILTNLVVQLELAKISLRKETPLIQLIDRPILPLAIDKLGKLKSIVIGAIISGFMAILFLTFFRSFNKAII